MHRFKLGELLISNRIITQQQLSEALEHQRMTKLPLGATLVSMGFITEDLLLKVLAAQMGVTGWFLDQQPPDIEALKLIPVKTCLQHFMIPLQLRGDLLVVGFKDPQDLEAVEAARTTSGYRIETVLVDEQRLSVILTQLETEGVEGSVIGNKVEEALQLVSDQVVKNTTVELADADERPVVALVNQLLSDAIRMGASDIHLEPREFAVELRCRIDGELSKLRDIPITLQKMLVTRLKIMAELDIVETRVPQNGRLSARIDGRTVDIRLSTLPNLFGERVVLRVLDKTKSLVSLENLGFSGENLGLYRELANKPYGIFLVTGPTGSGKTTSLYAALNEIKSVRNNIMTCEDPIEYNVPGLNQSQVNERVGLTYNAQLKAILRQDPDIILVGEIRDEETAITTVRAAMTGHLVFSTLHTNDAVSALPRLMDMGVEPFIVASSLIGVMSQRLIRKVCPHCLETREPNDQERMIIEAYHGHLPHGAQIAEGRGCGECFSAGVRGRTGIHEILPVTDHLRDMIADNVSARDLRTAAHQIGFKPMQYDVLNRVLNHEVSLSEAMSTIYFDTVGMQAGTLLRVA
ncbi:MAG: type II/IV secretion system protein [Chthonomonas sp.]|nr:type II/IV secretion system protein [Chthonomonas sp.]